jgi:formylglycine-generating enzyme required for sulfatase activity
MSNKHRWRLGVMVLGAWLVTTPALAAQRAALIIGNSQYKGISPLRNPVNDAEDVSRKLKDLGFDTILIKNGSLDEMVRGLKSFQAKLEKNGTAVFYYAGHGVQVGGQNFLLPVTANLDDDDSLKRQAIMLQDDVISRLAASGARNKIVIIDACRNNPFKSLTRAAERGLARMDIESKTSTVGLMMLFSAKPDQKAQDGDGRNSPFTQKLLEYLGEPGLTVPQLFSKLQKGVLDLTGQKQEVYHEGDMLADFSFKPGAAAMVTATAVPVPGPYDAELLFWETIKNSQNIKDYEAYRRQYPAGRFLALAENRIEDLGRSGNRTPAATVAQPGREGRKGVLRDCSESWCPELVVIPAGKFTMGSPKGEGTADETPQHPAQISVSLAVGKYEVTRGQFARFIQDSGYDAGKDWAAYSLNGKSQEDNHPVINVSWRDAKAYARWLETKTGKPYRLLTEAEWEYAARAGRATPWVSGDVSTQTCAYGNVADNTAKQFNSKYAKAALCDDGVAFTAPVGRYKPNAFGLHDTMGNVWEWVEDCWHDNYTGAPANGSAWTGGDCSQRVLRGGSWSDIPDKTRSANRIKFRSDGRDNSAGFRVVRNAD